MEYSFDFPLPRSINFSNEVDGSIINLGICRTVYSNGKIVITHLLRDLEKYKEFFGTLHFVLEIDTPFNDRKCVFDGKYNELPEYLNGKIEECIREDVKRIRAVCFSMHSYLNFDPKSYKNIKSYKKALRKSAYNFQ